MRKDHAESNTDEQATTRAKNEEASARLLALLIEHHGRKGGA